MNPKYIIIQAGGKGTRLEYLTANKPKALVPINNLPIIFHIFKKFPDKRFIIIGDYKYDALKQYLETWANICYLLVDAKGRHGTCAGISDALKFIPDDESFMLIWSDLILPSTFSFPEKTENYIGLSGDFQCRWKYENNVFEESPSIEYGVAGLFIFKNKLEIQNIPKSGEFVRWLKDMNLQPETLTLSKTKEYGLLSEYNKLQTSKCRPFNMIQEEDDKIIKKGIDAQGKQLAVREKNWYLYVEKLGFTGYPKIYAFEPNLIMEKINGKNIYEYKNSSLDTKKIILKSIVGLLKNLHSLSSASVDYFSLQEAYFTKTIKRLQQVRNMIPLANQKYIVVNGKKCRNVFFHKTLLENQLKNLECKEFKLLHGDCTFSNIMLKDDKYPILIDPRGYFGYSEMYGDSAYDWAKLYYSIVGNYDCFNQKKFRLKIDENQINLQIESNGFEALEDFFLDLISDEVTRKQIQLIHAIIWLSLTTYAWEDYDSICGAFYNGLFYLEDVLDKK